MADRGLRELRLQGLGVIADAVVPLGPGLTVVTGETGAGKTMVLQALDLVCGGRADPGAVRRGDARAHVEARVHLDDEGRAQVAEAGGELDDDGSVVAVRTVGAEGRSRAALGGVGVPAALLDRVLGAVVEVHGQHAQQRLLRPAEQRLALDRFAGAPVMDPLGRWRATWDRWREVRRLIADLTRTEEQRLRELDLARHGLARIAAVDPSPGEDDALRAESERLLHADALRAAVEGAVDLLAGEADATVAALASNVHRLLAEGAAHDAQLGEWAARARELVVLATDLAGDAGSAADGFAVDPDRLEAVQQRRAELAGLARVYGGPAAPGVDGVLAWAERARALIDSLEEASGELDGLLAEEASCRERLAAVAGELGEGRRRAAVTFAAAVTAELRGLGMAAAEILVEVTPLSTGEEHLDTPTGPRAVGPHGGDEVQVLLASAPGAPARPLARGASGGELSRVMLAVEVVFAASDDTPTLVFDEVDAGVGGRAAVEVGRRLARLAQHHQVVVVTHLPQVAAYGDHHLVVVKEATGEVTASGVTLVQGEARVVELARMLAGDEGSSSAREHAEELLARAAAEGAARGRPLG